MKRFLWLTLALCLVLTVFIACSKDEEPVEETQEETSAEESETKKVVDKYDKYRSDGTESKEEETTKPDETEPPVSNDGYGEVFNWDDGKNYVYTTLKLNTDNAAENGIKILGERYANSSDFIPCDWTGSGLEFKVTSLGGSISFDVKSVKVNNASVYMGTLFRAYVDGNEWKNVDGTPYYNVFGRGTVALRNIPAGEHTVKLVKVTGYTLSLVDIYSVKYTGTISTDPIEDNELYIEFVGDSISCGWGTIGEGGGLYTDQDGTLGYPYLIAENLEADYSITALSGMSVVGNSWFRSISDGYKYASIGRDDTTEYGFERKADLVVVNAGTNDVWINENDEETFKTGYKALIDYIRAKNGEDCKILCVYGCMVTDGYTNNIPTWISEWYGDDAGVYAIGLSGPGSGQNKHPTASEQAAHAEALIPQIKTILGIQ